MIDVHHYLAPPAYIADLKKHQRGAPPTLEWTPEKSLVDMDSSGIATAVLSITTPGVWFGDGDDAGAATLARACNDYGAKLIADHGRRFGMFAALPLPAVDASFKEIEYALDTLKVDGVGHVHELRRQMARRSRLRTDLGRAQSPQGGGLYPSHGSELLPQSDRPGPGADHRIRHRHHAHNRKSALHRHRLALPRHASSSSRMLAAPCRS